jgi:hypothetical protein
VRDVVEQAYRDAALVRGDERGQDERRRTGLDADVVQGEVETRFRRVDEIGDLTRDRRRRLPAVDERRQLDQGLARSAALWARFCAW